MSATLVAGVFIGRITSSQPPPLPSESASILSGPRISSEAAAEAEGIIRAMSDEGKQNGKAALKELTNLATRAITTPPGNARVLHLQQALAAIDSTNWRGAFEIFWRARTRNLISEKEQLWIMERIGNVAGLEAMERFKPRDPINNAETHNSRHAMKGWALRDPESALAYVKSQQEGRFREGMLWGYLAATALTDPPAALRAMEAAQPEEQTRLLRNLVLNEDGGHFEGLVSSWLEQSSTHTVADPNLRHAVFDALVNSRNRQVWSDPDGSRTLSWLGQFVGQPYAGDDSIVRGVAAVAERSGYAKTLEWVDAISAKRAPLAENATAQLFATWSRKDLAGSGAWLDSHRDSPIYQPAVAAFLRANRNQLDAATSRAWIETIPDPKFRAALHEDIFAANNPPR